MYRHLPAESFVDLHGLSHHVLTWEGAEGPTLVLLHGWLDLAWSWQPLAERLAGRRLVALDFRGHGDSGRVPRHDYYHFVDYVRDLHGLLPRVAPEGAVLVGHSMGGTVAAMYAGAFPDRVRGLVVVDGLGAPASPPDEAPHRVQRWLAGVDQVLERAPRAFAAVDEAAARLRAVNPRLPEDLSLFLAGKGTRPRPDGRLEWKHDPLHTTRSPAPFHLPHFLAFLRSVRCPALVVHATESFMTSFGDVPERSAAIPGRLEQWIECGHMVHHERPDELAQAIAGFLSA